MKGKLAVRFSSGGKTFEPGTEVSLTPEQLEGLSEEQKKALFEEDDGKADKAAKDAPPPPPPEPPGKKPVATGDGHKDALLNRK